MRTHRSRSPPSLIAEYREEAKDQQQYFPAFSGKLNFAPSMCRAADARLQQERPSENHPLRPTPRTIIEAIMFCVRERGPQALHEPGNIERLSRCDNAAIAEIDARIRKLKSSHAP
jgi:hypothetical protein